MILKHFQEKRIAKAGALQGGETPGFSNLDELLAGTGPLSPETAPILMPTDLLFDYDQANLMGAAVSSLEKLGTLIRRNPQAIFHHRRPYRFLWFGRIQPRPQPAPRGKRQSLAGRLHGHPRPQRIEARGYGKSRLIAPASGTIEEQQINRRVEIVIRAK